MTQAKKKVIYTDVDDAAVCRSDGTVIPPKVRVPVKASRPVLVFGEVNPSETVDDDPQPEGSET